jgi:hypothetical protein
MKSIAGRRAGIDLVRRRQAAYGGTRDSARHRTGDRVAAEGAQSRTTRRADPGTRRRSTTRRLAARTQGQRQTRDQGDR